MAHILLQFIFSLKIKMYFTLPPQKKKKSRHPMSLLLIPGFLRKLLLFFNTNSFLREQSPPGHSSTHPHVETWSSSLWGPLEGLMLFEQPCDRSLGLSWPHFLPSRSHFPANRFCPYNVGMVSCVLIATAHSALPATTCSVTVLLAPLPVTGAASRTASHFAASLTVIACLCLSQRVFTLWILAR